MQGSRESDMGYKPIPQAKDEVNATQNTETGSAIETFSPKAGLTKKKTEMMSRKRKNPLVHNSKLCLQSLIFPTSLSYLLS